MKQGPSFGAGIGNILLALETGLAGNHARETSARSRVRAQAISLLAQSVGAIILSRACPRDSSLADEILDACRDDCRVAIQNRTRGAKGRAEDYARRPR